LKDFLMQIDVIHWAFKRKRFWKESKKLNIIERKKIERVYEFQA